MPKYRSLSPYELILGNFHYGVNAHHEDKTKHGAVVLIPGEIIELDEEFDHPLVELVTDSSKNSKVDLKPAVDAPADAPVDAVEAEPVVEAPVVSSSKKPSK